MHGSLLKFHLWSYRNLIRESRNKREIAYGPPTGLIDGKYKVKARLSPCLNKNYNMKTYDGVQV